MSSSKRSLFAIVRAGLALCLSCAANKPRIHDEVQRLIELSRDSNVALMRGDSERYFTLVKQSEDFTLMSPFGGQPTHGVPTSERQQAIGKFFRNGTLEQELIRAYASPDMVVLATIERAHVEAGGLPAQNWGLRVTLVYRREGSEWRLVHRHADPLAKAISLSEAALLGRGEPAMKGAGDGHHL